MKCRAQSHIPPSADEVQQQWRCGGQQSTAGGIDRINLRDVVADCRRRHHILIVKQTLYRCCVIACAGKRNTCIRSEEMR